MVSPQVARAASLISFRILCASSQLASRSGGGGGGGGEHLRYVSRVGLSAQFHPRVHRVQVQRLPRVSRCCYGAPSAWMCRRVLVVASCGCACSVSWPSTWRVFTSGPPRPRRNDRSCHVDGDHNNSGAAAQEQQRRLPRGRRRHARDAAETNERALTPAPRHRVIEQAPCRAGHR